MQVTKGCTFFYESEGRKERQSKKHFSSWPDLILLYLDDIFVPLNVTQTSSEQDYTRKQAQPES